MKRFFLRPVITEKSMAQSANSVYQFLAPTWATKNEIREAVTNQFGVTVLSVSTARSHSDLVTFKRRPGQKAMVKKATVSLKKGDTIHSFSLPVEATEPAKETEEPKAEPVTPTESTITVRSRGKKGEK